MYQFSYLHMQITIAKNEEYSSKFALIITFWTQLLTVLSHALMGKQKHALELPSKQTVLAYKRIYA